jgi:hypothetical protein
MNAIVQQTDFSTLLQQATALVQSGFLPKEINSPQKAVAIMMLGQELGFTPWVALTGINVIQGKPSCSPQLMLAKIYASNQLEDMTITDDGTACTVTMKRKGRSSISFTFSQDDARKMNLAGKDNWQKQPKVMRQWRAVAACARIVFPDVITNLYTPDEMGADVTVSEDGEMTVISTPAPQLPAAVSTRLNGSAEKRLPTDPLPPPPPPAERWWFDADSGEIFRNDALQSDMNTVNMTGPFDSKADADAAKERAIAAKSEQQPAPQSPEPPAAPLPTEAPELTPEEEAERDFEEIPSAPLPNGATLDDDAQYKDFEFDRVRLVKRNGGNGFMYILTKLRRNANPTLFTGDLLRAAGLPVDGWKDGGEGMRVLPGSYIARAKFDNRKQAWTVKSVTAPEAPKHAQDAPELPANAGEIAF